MKRIVLVIIGCVLFCLAWNSGPGAQDKAIKIGDTFPGFFLKDVNGKNFFLNNYVGENPKNKCKALILSFSASYCKPCKKEIPEIGKFMKKYGDKGLVVFIIALEKEFDARKLIVETKTTLPVLLDRYLVVPKMIGNRGIPYTVLLDEKGTVKLINTGFSEENAQQFIERMENEVIAVLGINNSTSR